MVRSLADRTFQLRLSAGDRIRIVEGACGGKNSTPALHGPLRADPDAAAAFGNATYLRWESVELRDVGDFTVCWCSASVTCAWQDYRTPAGVVRVAATAGPAYANVTAVAAGVPFAVRVVGFNMSTSDRARIRTPVNNIEYFPPNFEGLVLGCIDADFCK